jgi:hypothetical protein
MDSYARWVAQQAAGRRRPILYLAGLALTVVAGLWLYDVVKNISSKSAIDEAERQLIVPLNQQLDSYLNSLAPALQRAGLAIKEFRDVSKPAHDSNMSANGIVRRKFVSARDRELVSIRGQGKTVVRASINTEEIKPEDVKAGRQYKFKASTRLTVTIQGPRDCPFIVDVAFRAARRPIESRAAQRYDAVLASPASRSNAQTLIKTACERNEDYSVPMGIGGELRVQRLAASWWLVVNNSGDVEF